MLFKNTASQRVRVFAFDATTGLPKSGDAANIAAYIAKDYGAVTQLTDTSATEEDATNAKGYYWFDITQTETNADNIMVTGKSSTANIVVVGSPAMIATRPPNAGALSIDSNGRVDVIKINGTSQTARDIGASVLLSAGTGTGQLDFTSGVVKANATQWLGGTIPAVNVTGVPLVDLKYTLGTLSAGAAGYVGPDWGHVNAPTTTVNLSGTTVLANVNKISGDTISPAALVAYFGNMHVGAQVDGASSTTTAVASNMSGFGDDFFAGMTIRFYSANNGTKDLSGLEREIKNYTSTSGTFTLTKALPAAPGIGDSFIVSHMSPLQSTVAGRTLDVAATGEAGLDFDNIHDATGAHTLTNIRVPNVTLTDTVTTYTGNVPQTGDAYNRLGAPAGVSIAADIAAIPTANANADALLDRTDAIETGLTPRQAHRVLVASAAGKLSGAATSTIKIRDLADTKDRITATVDADGNRTAITTILT